MRYLNILLTVLFFGLLIATFAPTLKNQFSNQDPQFASSTNPLAPRQRSPLYYSFEETGTIEEAPSSETSSHLLWWVNSGASLTLRNGIGSTVKGNLSKSSRWYSLYNTSNPTDTDRGLHPQNIFRLVTKPILEIDNLSQEVYFRIKDLNLSESANRNESNGVLLLNRYQDGDNLYYTGLRVDGFAVIKKKAAGTYYTMAYEPIFQGKKYDRTTNPNLLPLNEWIGIKTEIKNIGSEYVFIKLYMDRGRTGTWNLIATVIDDGKSYGGDSMLKSGHGGIRSDFMDIEFDDYKVGPVAPPNDPGRD